MTTPKTVYQLIAEVTAMMAKEGISKDRKNQQQGYSFRGIDDVYNVLGTMLGETGLVIMPRVLSESVVERATKSGGVLIYTKVRVKYVFVSSHDGSTTYSIGIGEASDSADKSSNKAQSSAYKYMAFQVFCIPTEGDNDADATTEQPVAKPVAKPVAAPKEAKPMPHHEFEAARMDIGAAATLDELKKTFTEAYNAAKAYGDTPAMVGLEKIKDVRKNELTQTKETE